MSRKKTTTAIIQGELDKRRHTRLPSNKQSYEKILSSKLHII